MYYKLNPDIALRSWSDYPYGYYIRNNPDIHPLTQETFALLSKCDSLHDLPDSPELALFTFSGHVSPCQKGEGNFSAWQRMTCDNKHYPSLNWMITGKCNYNCRHCFNARDNAPLMSEFTLEEGMHFLDEVQRAGINSFTITGGEPMLHSHFNDFIRGIYDRGMYVAELNTNGYFINDESLKALSEIGCRPLIKISFDGIGHHDWLRNFPGAEQITLDAIRCCARNGFRVMIQTNVFRSNVSSLQDTVDLMEKLGAERIRFIRTTEVPRWDANAPGETLNFEEYFESMLVLAEKFREKPHTIYVDIWQFLKLNPEKKQFKISPVLFPKGQLKESCPVCPSTRKMPAVTAEGELYPCMQMSGKLSAIGIRMGNVKESGLIPLLRSGTFVDTVCSTVGMKAEANETCRNCRWFQYCGGGCPALSINYNGSFLSCDPLKCLFFNNGYYERIEELFPDWENLSPLA
ncbi:MAG: radical SAM protein [Eubacteriales bacterium]|nr:radical SAM protein [Eubacteriales bacterium]